MVLLLAHTHVLKNAQSKLLKFYLKKLLGQVRQKALFLGLMFLFLFMGIEANTSDMIFLILLPVLDAILIKKFIKYSKQLKIATKDFNRKYAESVKPQLIELEKTYNEAIDSLYEYSCSNGSYVNFLPNHCRNYHAVDFIIKAIDDEIVETYGAAVMLYEQKRHNEEMENIEKEKLEEERRLSYALDRLNSLQEETNSKLIRANKLLKDIEKQQSNQYWN